MPFLKSAGTKSNGKKADVERVYKDLCNKEECVQLQCKTYLEEQQSAKTAEIWADHQKIRLASDLLGSYLLVGEWVGLPARRNHPSIEKK